MVTCEKEADLSTSLSGSSRQALASKVNCAGESQFYDPDKLTGGLRPRQYKPEEEREMAQNRMLSLNDVSDFSVEDLEPRMEMQVLGIGSDIIHFHGRKPISFC